MTEYPDKYNLAESELKQVSGGNYDGNGKSVPLTPGSIDYPIMLNTDDAVKNFVAIAAKYDFSIIVYKGSVSVNGTDLAGLLAMDRSGFVHVMATGIDLNSFIREIDQFMIY